jgi:hypothetical protein
MRWRLRRRYGHGDVGNAELDARLSEAWEAAAAAAGRMLDLPAGKEALLASSGPSRAEDADLRAPGGLTGRAARQRRRRLNRPLVAAGAAVLTAAGVALAVVAVPGPEDLRTGGQAVDTAYVVKRLDSALGAAEPGAIAQLTVTSTGSAAIPGGMTTAEEWSYGAQWRSVTSSPSGHPVFDQGFRAASAYTFVNYEARTWARQAGLGRQAEPVPLVSGSRRCAAAVSALSWLLQPRLRGPGLAASSQPSTVASALRAAISCGTLAEAGRQRIDGTSAIELASRPGSPISETIWVSPGTYLPERVVVRVALMNAVLQRTADITWLKPTAQNLDKLTVPIPPGFRQVPLAEAGKVVP